MLSSNAVREVRPARALAFLLKSIAATFLAQGLADLPLNDDHSPQDPQL